MTQAWWFAGLLIGLGVGIIVSWATQPTDSPSWDADHKIGNHDE